MITIRQSEVAAAESARDDSSLGTLLKRTVDIIGSITGLVLLAPLLTVVALLIKVDSPGPAIFKQKRIGKGGKLFTFYKFRSMYQNCREDRHRDYMAKLISSNSNEELRARDGCFKMADDPRVTRLGRILRKSSLDEIPQLINVLKGEMSLVGPRPALPYEVEKYERWHMRRLSVTPGITGLWQVSGRSEKNFHEMVELDLKYIDDWSLWLDFRTILKTFWIIFNTRGAW